MAKRKVSSDQLSFAKRMTARQWDTLRALADFPFYLSASERGDPELYALIRWKFAQCFTNPLFSWAATDTGKALVRMRERGTA